MSQSGRGDGNGESGAVGNFPGSDVRREVHDMAWCQFTAKLGCSDGGRRGRKAGGGEDEIRRKTEERRVGEGLGGAR